MNAIPTKYKGIQFRSRLEATWAAFFDLCGWQWEYEPCDFDGWIPDFLIRGVLPVFAEVKPWATEKEIVVERAWSRALQHRPEELLILGIGPFKGVDGPQTNAIGWLCEKLDATHGCNFGQALWGRTSEDTGAGFCHSYMSYQNRVSGAYDGNPCISSFDELLHLWAGAKNMTQWSAPLV